ncbi:hypothetical protein JRO89_XS07G0298700 [Xanthoceras sorbifolium]|uniref:Uncharacterized protein n=1 Tax=Xanthoceras sorbifolium TaxID=99658 RepID=A0ABQ8HVZ9_9ROSI|nr:hypothetical protein JRO89_XS07G0298700 [Xanthoceras sorbifolium]
MSRCVAFPPPGYVWNGASGEALLEAVKIWKEKAAAEKKRKKKEKRKRELEDGELEEGEIREERCCHKHKKRKQKEQRNGELEDGDLEEGQIREERCSHKHKKSKTVGETRDCQLNKEYEYELSETSNLTEEHDQQMCDSLYDSSDNTENFKRKIVPTSVVKDLAARPHRELFGSSYADETAPAFSSNESHLQNIESQYRELFEKCTFPPFQNEQQPKVDDYQEWLFDRRLPRSDTTETSNAWNHDLHSKSSSLYPCDETAPAFSSNESHLQHIELQYRELFEECTFPPFQNEQQPKVDDYQEWLFDRRLPRSNTTETAIAWNHDLHSRSSSLYPCAHSLPQADIHALPYALLF